MRRSGSNRPANRWIHVALAVAASTGGAAHAVGPNFRIESNLGGAEFGTSVANAGDVNGDGIDDLIVGAPHWTENGYTDEGAVFVFYGRPGGFPKNMTVADADAKIVSNQGDPANGGARLGTSVASVGDVNHDGYGDIGIGAGGWDGGQANEGAVFIVLGGPNGIPSGGLEVASSVLQGDWQEARLGTTIGHADVNGDGYDDVISGGRLFQNDANVTDEGYALIFLGGPNGIPSGGLATADTVLQSNRCGALFGDGADGVGDVNGDGYGDVVVGAPRWTGSWTTCPATTQTPPDSREGAALLYLGGPNGIPSGDWTTADAIIEGQQLNARFGQEVRGVGDVNGDQIDDFAIGATHYDDGQTDEGAVFVFYGRQTWPSPDQHIMGPDEADAELQGDQVDVIPNGVVREEFGLAIDAGDYDGDGYRDLLVSSAYFDHGQTDEGAAFLFRGGPTGIQSAGTGSADRIFESNVKNAWMGSDVAFVDIDGDGKDDVFVGGARMGWPLFPVSEGSEGMVLGFPRVTACQNGIDDDGDGKVDLADPGCTDADDQHEEVDYGTGASPVVTTGIDDDVLSHDLPNGAPTTVDLAAGGSTTGDFRAIEHSIVQLDGGAVGGDVVASDEGAATINGGSVGGRVIANGSAVVAIHGGSVAALEAHDTARIELYGLAFDLPNGEITATSGTITGTLEDGTPITATFQRDAGATLLVVPEPGAAAVAIAALAPLAALRRRARRAAESRAR